MTGVDGDTERRVREYVCAVFPDLSADCIAQVYRLDAGENHDVYRVSMLAPETADVVVRIATSERARDCGLAQREAQVLEKVRGLAAPGLHDFRCASAWFDAPTTCMQFVDGAQRPPRDAEDVERLGVVVGAVHALTVDDLDGWVSPNLTLAGYLDARIARIDERLLWVRDPLPIDVQRRLRRARSMLDEARMGARNCDAFQRGERLVLLHGDVAGGNLLWSPTPVLIDWEYARMGDAADEVAYIFNQNELSEPDRLAFWRGYLQGPGPEHKGQLAERVKWWEPVTVLGSAFFWVQSWSRRATADQIGGADPSAPREQEYYADHTVRRLERAEALLEALGFSANRG